jgi:hypothetical protein
MSALHSHHIVAVWQKSYLVPYYSTESEEHQNEDKVEGRYISILLAVPFISQSGITITCNIRERLHEHSKSDVLEPNM